MRLVAPLTLARIARKLTFHRRLVTLWAWLMLLPNCGPLPQISHTCAIDRSPEGYRTWCVKNRFYRISAILANSRLSTFVFNSSPERSEEPLLFTLGSIGEKRIWQTLRPSH